MINLTLAWGSLIVVFILALLAVIGIDFSGLPRGGHYARASALFSATIPVLAFWYFERVVICIISYRIVKRTNKNVQFLGKKGFVWISLRKRK